MTTAVRIAPGDPLSALLTAAADLSALAREHADRTEADRRVPQELIEQFRDAGLYRVLQPAAFGGYEAGFDAFAQIVAHLARGDGSTGWVFSVCAVHQWLIGLFPPEAQDDVWGSKRDAFAAGSYAPVGRAQKVDGGYRMTGAWSFASGCDTSDWLLLGSIFQPSEDAAPFPGFFLVPAKDYRIDPDSWRVAGLAGTGSRTVHLDSVFVPEHRVLSFAAGTSGQAPGAQLNTSPLYRIPFMACVPTCLVAPVLGMAEGALELYLDTTLGRNTRGAVAGGNNRMAEFATVQMRVADASARIDAARTVLMRDIAETRQTAEAGQPIGLDMRLRNRRSHAFTVKLLVEAVDALFYGSGGTALDLARPLQRFWRDTHAGGVHISTNWDAVSTMYGQHALGLEPKGQY
ncbi:acyl-CoA dehydrogenase family protein [Novosphingobium terrae]|uniref:acyl-CoA dehydrogenase family protein n=1 Tax=Novosphingobium terrae TaxID=2726189 RepID=UPI0019826C6D|nr:acyl-CoA dehydrogenase family protein [Novosphingobium terrae]